MHLWSWSGHASVQVDRNSRCKLENEKDIEKKKRSLKETYSSALLNGQRKKTRNAQELSVETSLRNLGHTWKMPRREKCSQSWEE